MDHQDRSVAVVNDTAGDAAKQHRAQARQSSRAHRDHRCLLSLGRLEDRLPNGTSGLDNQGLGFQAHIPGEAYALCGYSIGVRGRRTIELGEVHHRRRSGPGEAARVRDRLPNRQDQCMAAGKETAGLSDSVLGIFRAVVTEHQSFGSGHGRPFLVGAGG